MQQELKDMGEDEELDYEYEDDGDEDDLDYEYEEEDWEVKMISLTKDKELKGYKSLTV